jgi:rSAM/selenodomain-associated transferase 2
MSADHCRRGGRRTDLPKLSVIIPVLDEAERIASCLQALQPLQQCDVEVVVVDGGSRDDTVARARLLADRVIPARRGRASQMNAGAAAASGDVLLFLHADTALPPDADQLVLQALRTTGRDWGRFDVSIAGRHPMLAVVAWFMNRRSRLTGISTGDQALFMRRGTFTQVGGFPPLALMEDVAMSAALKRTGRPVCLDARVTTSGRRWEKNGLWRTILLMWRLRLAFFLGADPGRLADAYGHVSVQD